MKVYYDLEGCLEIESIVFSIKYKEDNVFSDFPVSKKELKVLKNKEFSIEKIQKNKKFDLRANV